MLAPAQPDSDRAPGLDPLERAAGLPLGLDGPARSALLPSSQGARAALETEVLHGLYRPPCVISFSGSRDSSAILALAATLARKEGLPDPIPVSWRFQDAASAHESPWQELVVEHLGLRDWERLSLGDELELLGEIATTELRAHGLLWPPRIHLQVPVLERARGGSVLTAFDSDGLLGGWAYARPLTMFRGTVRPEPRDRLRATLGISPLLLRRRVRPPVDAITPHVPWLRLGALREAVDRYLNPRPPRRWDLWLAWYSRHRYLRFAAESLSRIAHSRNVAVGHPLLAPAFLSALAREGGPSGIGATRTDAMRFLFSDLLPDAVLSRRDTAEFGRVLWGERSRSFAGSWQGAGVDLALVDDERLREAWRMQNPLFGSCTLLQGAWLASAV